MVFFNKPLTLRFLLLSFRIILIKSGSDSLEPTYRDHRRRSTQRTQWSRYLQNHWWFHWLLAWFWQGWAAAGWSRRSRSRWFSGFLACPRWLTKRRSTGASCCSARGNARLRAWPGLHLLSSVDFSASVSWSTGFRYSLVESSLRSSSLRLSHAYHFLLHPCLSIRIPSVFCRVLPSLEAMVAPDHWFNNFHLVVLTN